MILFWLSYTTSKLDLFLEARAEILTNISLFFWSIWRHQKDISKLTDLYLKVFKFRFMKHVKLEQEL